MLIGCREQLLLKESDAMSAICEICDKVFKANKNLYEHKRNVHRLKVNAGGPNVRPEEECRFTCRFVCELRNHMDVVHGISCQKSDFVFSSKEEFLLWKGEQEKATTSTFVLRCGQQRLANGAFKMYYMCNRSGSYTPKVTRKRQLKSQGSCKAGVQCLAGMDAVIEEGKVSVSYYSTHLIHDFNLAHTGLQEQEKAEIAGKLAGGVTMQHVRDEIRDNVSEKELSRIHLITRKDLRNIKAEYHIHDNTVKYHPNDKISVGLWVENVPLMKETPVLLFKQQGEEYSDGQLTVDDFMLVLMMPVQQELLQKLGTDKICVDSTHGTTVYDFYLTTLLTVDEYGSGLPCAYCFSNRIESTAYAIFFGAVRAKVGSISCKIFMSDDAQAIYNAWKGVMGSAERQLLCTWHVDRNWRKKVRELFREKAVQALVYKTLRTLLEESDVQSFKKMLLDFCKSLNTKETEAFHKYFTQHYASRPESWAYCYRKNAGINTNMYLEAMHRVLKHCYMEGKKKNKRLDTCISIILKMTRDKMFDRLIKLCKGSLSHRVAKIHSSHKSSKLISDDAISVVYDGLQWNVKSQSTENHHYTVEKNVEIHQKCCQLLCKTCDTCIHGFSCTCPDSFINLNMCKHIHALISSLRKKESICIKSGVEDGGADSSASRSECPLEEASALFKRINQTSDNGQDGRECNDDGSVAECVMKYLQTAAGHITRGRVKASDINSLNDFLNNWLQTVATDYSPCNKTVQKEPSNKKLCKQIRYRSTKKKNSKCDPAVTMTKPSVAQKENIKSMLQYPEMEIVDINTESDHLY